MAKQKNKRRILFRFGVITAALVAIALAIGFKLAYTTTVQAADWERDASRQIGVRSVIYPERGSILASDGSILACNMMVWDMKLDMQHPKLAKPDKKTLASIDSLADWLDEHYPRRADLASLPPDSAAGASWHTRFQRELDKPLRRRNRALVVAKGVDKSVYEELRHAPLMSRFLKTSNIPLYSSERYVRRQPYGMMARYSIGVVNEQRVIDSIVRKVDKNTGRPYLDTVCHHEVRGYSGLEKDLDSLLFGRKGTARSVTMNAGLGRWAEQPAQRGYDVVTTIDLHLQDILEQELHERCAAVGAKWGCAMLMEVATGEIKAISNLERRQDGTYGEAYNRTVSCFEPGSVIKPVSLLIAFEDGLINSNNNTVDCSPFMKTKDPHAPTVKTIPEVMGWSSNTGVARIIFRGYQNKPEAFRDRWAQLGLFDKFHSGIAEERPPRMRRLEARDAAGNPITMTARHLDLARQAFGYSVEISPLYLLSIYNAIANDGRYVRPHLVRALRMPDKPDSVLKFAPVRESVCTPEHAAMLRVCLRHVVTHGTARSAKLDEVVEIAGKTGTCYPVFPKGEGKGYDLSKRRFAFAGFFPYQNPRYSCVVLVEAPAGSGGAGSISGKVLSRVAERMYARGMLGDMPSYQALRQPTAPVLANAETDVLRQARARLGASSVKRLSGTDPAQAPTDKVPDVRNCDARTAVRQLERRGLNVTIKGSGRVIAQSLQPGNRFRRGDRIILQLD